MSGNPRLMLRAMLGAGLAAALAACAHHGPPPLADTGPPPPPPGSGEGPPSPPPYAGMQGQAGAATPGSVRDFVVSAGDRIFFDTNESGVSSQGQQVLNMQAQWLQRYPQVVVRIEGNCDERGTREYNLALGARRAEAVKDYLVGQGLSASRITTISYGKEHPIDAGAGEEAWNRDRNAHTAITGGAVGGASDQEP